MDEFTTKLQLLEAIMAGSTDIQCESTDERRLLLKELVAAGAETTTAVNWFSDDDTDHLVVARSDSNTNNRITCYVETSAERQTIMFAQVADLFLPSEQEISRQDFDAAFAILMSRGDDDG